MTDKTIPVEERKLLSHEAALDAICGCAATVTVLSYQEAIEAYLDLRGFTPVYAERLEYERRILAAECGTQRVLNEFEAKLRQMAQQARSVPDVLDPKAAEIIENIAGMVREIDVVASDAARLAALLDTPETVDKLAREIAPALDFDTPLSPEDYSNTMRANAMTRASAVITALKEIAGG